MIDNDKIAELRRLEAEATPGKWELVSLSGYGSPFSVRMAYHSDNPNAPKTHYGVQSIRTREDAALIVAMRNALPELLKALEDATALLRRVPSALNGAFMAGTEEREGGSARRQDKYAKEGDDLRREIPEFLRTLPPHGGGDVG